MKKQILFLFSVLTLTTAFGQFNVYHPFPDSNAYWKESASAWWGAIGSPGNYCEGYGYVLKGDTLVNGIIHHKLNLVSGYYNPNASCYGSAFGYSNKFYGAIREDSAKRIYLCCTSVGSKDTLLYDFNLKVGDSLKQSTVLYPGTHVSSIDSILIDGNYRKQWIIAVSNNTVFDSIIEGIGSMQGLVERIAPVFESSCNLLCFRQNGNILQSFGNGPFNDSCTVYGPEGVKEIGNERPFVIYPNPATTSVAISYHWLLRQNSVELKLYNTLGELVKNNAVNTGTGLTIDDVSALPNGIYYYTLLVNGTITATSKLVVIH
jgi:hypothetical protein